VQKPWILVSGDGKAFCGNADRGVFTDETTHEDVIRFFDEASATVMARLLQTQVAEASARVFKPQEAPHFPWEPSPPINC